MITPHTHIACTVDTIDVPPPGTVHTISLIVGGQPSNPLPWTVPRMIILTNTTVVAISGMMIIQAADIGLRDNVGSNLNITLYIDSFAIPCLITSDSSSTISCLCSISRVVSSSCGDADIYVRVIDTFALMEAYANVTLLLPSLVVSPAYYRVTSTQGGTVLFDTTYYNAGVKTYVIPLTASSPTHTPPILSSLERPTYPPRRKSPQNVGITYSTPFCGPRRTVHRLHVNRTGERGRRHARLFGCFCPHVDKHISHCQ
eukprot:TRINITY_DN5973_c0_g1_i3.p1 TRINITY_DN5973_c0_g1~~TRINITY_DN5973_c0_g1_i3.p1  ORF type:complete len:294 (-),score=32.75 TRINITY_DN5973_c0_g1_i3:369-1142(-)